MASGNYWQHKELQRKRESREALIKLCWVVAPVAVLVVVVWMQK